MAAGVRIWELGVGSKGGCGCAKRGAARPESSGRHRLPTNVGAFGTGLDDGAIPTHREMEGGGKFHQAGPGLNDFGSTSTCHCPTVVRRESHQSDSHRFAGFMDWRSGKKLGVKKTGRVSVNRSRPAQLFK